MFSFSDPKDLYPSQPAETNHQSIDFSDHNNLIPDFDPQSFNSVFSDKRENNQDFMSETSAKNANYDKTLYEAPHMVKRTRTHAGFVHKRAGDTLKLECLVDGSPMPNIVWFKVRNE